MRFYRLGLLHRLKSRRVSPFQFFLQVFPFVLHLASGHEYGGNPIGSISYFSTVKSITALVGFLPNFQKIATNGFSRRGMGFEAVQLGMIAVALRFSRQNFLGQEPFPPKGQKAFCIEIPRVKGPKPQNLFLGLNFLIRIYYGSYHRMPPYSKSSQRPWKTPINNRRAWTQEEIPRRQRMPMQTKTISHSSGATISAWYLGSE